MIKILKHGTQTWKTTCKQCGCEFTYENCDISPVSDNVNCPECGRLCYHDKVSNVYVGDQKYGRYQK